jgi:hypothetical protein
MISTNYIKSTVIMIIIVIIYCNFYYIIIINFSYYINFLNDNSFIFNNIS